MNNQDYFQIGLLKKPHGLKGDVNITFETAIDLEGIPALFLEIEGTLVPYFIESFSNKGEKATLKFEDINTIEEAKQIGARRVFLQKSVRPDLPKGQFYDDEIIGFQVEDENTGILGNLEEIIAAGSNRLFVVKKDSNEVLIPENGPFIKKILKDKRTILVSLPEGFLEMNN